jgi:hypothetical protein
MLLRLHLAVYRGERQDAKTIRECLAFLECLGVLEVGEQVMNAPG